MPSGASAAAARRRTVAGSFWSWIASNDAIRSNFGSAGSRGASRTSKPAFPRPLRKPLRQVLRGREKALDQEPVIEEAPGGVLGLREVRPELLVGHAAAGAEALDDPGQPLGEHGQPLAGRGEVAARGGGEGHGVLGRE